MWGDRFEVVVSTHLNTQCIHNHFVLNSVSFKDGYKYYSNLENTALFRKTSDDICDEFGLKVLGEKNCKSGINFENFYRKSFKDSDYYNFANAGFDYVGAPFVPDKDKYWSCLRRLWCKLNFYLRRYRGTDPHHSQWYQVGNGGLCLRNVSKFQDITKKYRQQIDNDLSDEKDFYPEDLWLSFELKGSDRLKTPDWKTALNFSIECSPKKCMETIGNKLPFGTHAWTLKKHRPFWQNYIK